jgi:hypothetical protein
VKRPASLAMTSAPIANAPIAAAITAASALPFAVAA